jgi:Ca2+:H+ antiporter
LLSHNSSGAIGTVKSRKAEADDDEVEVEDRGQALIRKRQKERKQMRRAKEREREERERRMAGQDNGDSSAPPTGLGEEPFSVQQARGMTSRSVSRTRVPSVGRDGRQASEGYFGSSIAGTETPVGQSPRDERRPESIYSSTVDEDEESVVPERAPSIIDEVVAEVLDEETGGHGTGDEVDDDDEEDEEAGEDGEVTLKDRQDVSGL